jgi:5-methylcytosine-specific restriction enzyme A
MSLLAEINPSQKNTIMSLAKEAGLDVSDWKNFKGGEKLAAADPNHCYEWSFVQRRKILVLNLWIDQIIKKVSTLVREFNIHDFARRPHLSPLDM